MTHVIAAITSQGPPLRDFVFFLQHNSNNNNNDSSILVVRSRDPATMVYIRQDKLPKLKEYKYSGVDHSLLSQYVMKPFYTHVVIKCFPMWMA